ncbi:MAG TPA: metal ABC transporter permease [Acidimicrobiales bacterium]|nr:metal ABC transporter permease [Acidimicrobiales bacterium]
MSAPVLALVDPVTGAGHMLSHPFMDYAFVAGTVIALATGLVGYFVVLRGQVFTGDALGHVAFTGSLAALALGVDLRVGLFVACVLVGVVMGALGRRGLADDVVIGNVFAWILGLGVLFLAFYATSRGGSNGTVSVQVLFGSIYGLSRAQAAVAAGIGGGAVVALLVIARPLLFASLDEAVASARGVPVRLLGLGFLALVGLTAGEATQAVGALLLLGLVAAPAGAAQRLTDRPWRAMWVSAGLSVLSMWAGLTLSYAVSALPPSFSILAVATACYVLSWAVTAPGRRRAVPAAPAP